MVFKGFVAWHILDLQDFKRWVTFSIGAIGTAEKSSEHLNSLPVRGLSLPDYFTEAQQ